MGNLKANESLVFLDLRFNPCFADEPKVYLLEDIPSGEEPSCIKGKISKLLRKNIEMARKSRAVLCPTWLNTNVLGMHKKHVPSLLRGLQLVNYINVSIENSLEASYKLKEIASDVRNVL